MKQYKIIVQRHPDGYVALSTPRSSKRLLLKQGSEMAKFPVGAPKHRVVKALELLGRGNKYLQSYLGVP